MQVCSSTLSLIWFLFRWLVLSACVANQLSAQLPKDTLSDTFLDSLKNIKTQIFIFEASEPVSLRIYDTAKSMISAETVPGIQLNNFYPIYAYNFDESSSDQFYGHGQNAVIKKESYFNHFKFFSPNKALSEIKLNRGRAILNSQKGFQDNFDVHVLFASRFRGNVIWNFSYDRSIHSGIYSFENQRHTLFKTGIHFNAFNERLHANILYLDTRYSHDNNWGIDADTLLYLDQYSVREALPVRNSSSMTSGFNRSIGVNALYQLAKVKSKYFTKLKFQSVLSRYSFSYFEPDAIDKSNLYGYFLIDTALAHDVVEDRWENTVGMSLIENNDQSLELLLKHTALSVADNPVINNRNLFQLECRYSNQYGNGYFNADAAVHLLKDKFYPELKFNYSTPLISTLNLNAILTHCTKPLPYVYTSLLINDEAIWSGIQLGSDYSKSGVHLQVKSESGIPVSISGSYSFYNKFIYLDQSSYPISEKDVAEFRFNVDSELKHKRLSYKLNIKYQYNQIDPYGFNGFSTAQEFKISSFLFKKVVRSEIGFRFTWREQKKRMEYNPLLQLFSASEVSGSSFYTVGSYFNFNVQEFQFSLKLDNIESTWNKEVPFITNHYPYYDFMLSMGISWKFVN